MYDQLEFRVYDLFFTVKGHKIKRIHKLTSLKEQFLP